MRIRGYLQVVLAILVPAGVAAQENHWRQIADLAGNMTASPSRRTSAACFSIADEGYMATGMNTSYYNNHMLKELWSYDEVAGKWSRKADIPAPGRAAAIAFSLGGKGYVGLGGPVGNSILYSDLWAYDPVTGSWTQRADFPPGGRKQACAFTAQGKAYVGTGTNGTYKKDLWAYDPMTNTWTQRADMPGTARIHATAYGVDGHGYIACGNDGVARSDVWRYDPANDTWLQRADVGDGVGRQGAKAFVIAGQAYITGGIVGSVMDLWKYDAPSDTWVARAAASGAAMSFCGAFSTTQYGYIYTAGVTSNASDASFQRYDPIADAWTVLGVPGGYGRLWATGFTADGKGYVANGSSPTTSKDLWEYDPVLNAWSKRATCPGPAREMSAGMSVGGAGFMCNGYDGGLSYGGVYEYQPATDQWISLGFPLQARFGGVAFNIGNKGYVGLGRHEVNFTVTFRQDVWEYDPVTLVWTQKANYPGSTRTNCVAFGANGKGYVGLGNTDLNCGTDMWEFDPVLNTWTQIDDPPCGPRTQAVSFSLGNKGYVGTGRNATVTDFNDMWEFDATAHTWLQVADCGGGWRLGGTSFVLNGKGYVGTGGEPAIDFWEYTPMTTPGVRVSAKVLLEGPYVQATQLMNDQLRSASLLPITEPYSALGHSYVNSLGGTTNAAALAVTGPDAIVDWVVIELRSSGAPATVVTSRSALLQRDGDIVDMDGTSSVLFAASAGSYHIAVRHRNHLGVMTATPLALTSTASSIDLTNPATAAFGPNARKAVGARMAMWAGDATGNGQLKYTGSANDRDPIILAVGGSTPNNTVPNVYDRRDTNLDGVIKYTGSANDRDIILTNVGSTTPNNTRTQQLP